MRKILFFALFFCLFSAMHGQVSKPKNLLVYDSQSAHLGYSVGINTMNFTYKPSPGVNVVVHQNPGININLVTSVKLAKYLDIRVLPGIKFGQRDITITRGIEVMQTKIESVYIDFPILLKYRAERVNNYAPYLVFGVNPTFDLIGAELKEWDKGPRLIQAFDIFPELGFGIDFYLSKVKVATELKFSVGLLDIYNAPPEEAKFELYTQAFERIMSRMVVLSFHIG